MWDVLSDLNEYRRLLILSVHGFEQIITGMSHIEELRGCKRLSAFLLSKREFIAAIDSMTSHERRYPALLLDKSRIHRIASGAGVLQKTLWKLLAEFQSQLGGLHTSVPLTVRPTPEVCDSYHRSVLAGKCPWCGLEITAAR